jgi:hypothetical protein
LASHIVSKAYGKISNDQATGLRRMDSVAWSVWAKNGACTYAMPWQALQDP